MDKHTQKLTIVVASFFIFGWIVLGPIIVPLTVPFFIKKGRSTRDDLKVPLLSSAMIISLGVGFITMKSLEAWMPISGLIDILTFIASVRLVPSSLSYAILSNQESAMLPFALEQVGGLLAFVFGMLVYRNPSILYRVVDDIFDKAESIPEQSPWSVVVISLFLSILFLFTFYYFPYDSYRLSKGAFVLSMLPNLLFAFCYVCAFYVLRYKKTHPLPTKK